MNSLLSIAAVAAYLGAMFGVYQGILLGIDTFGAKAWFAITVLIIGPICFFIATMIDKSPSTKADIRWTIGMVATATVVLGFLFTFFGDKG